MLSRDIIDTFQLSKNDACQWLTQRSNSFFQYSFFLFYLPFDMAMVNNDLGHHYFLPYTLYFSRRIVNIIYKVEYSE